MFLAHPISVAYAARRLLPARAAGKNKIIGHAPRRAGQASVIPRSAFWT